MRRDAREAVDHAAHAALRAEDRRDVVVRVEAALAVADVDGDMEEQVPPVLGEAHGGAGIEVGWVRRLDIAPVDQQGPVARDGGVNAGRVGGRRVVRHVERPVVRRRDRR